MLLSEVLYIAKNLKNNVLNESLASSLLLTIFRKYEYSSLTLTARNTRYSYSSYRDEGVTYLDLESRYKQLAKRNELTSELCDTVEGRLKMLQCTYKPKPTKMWNGEKTNNNLIALVYTILYRNNYHIGLSEITDLDLLSISVEDAKKKIYKTGLLFWIDYNDNLKAVTINNTIMLYVKSSGKYGSWMDINKNYNEKTDFSNFAVDEDAIDAYLEKAFKIIPVYDVLTNDSAIKKELGACNIKALLNESSIYKVLVVNPEGMSNNNITEKLATRKEYKDFLYNLTKLYERDSHRIMKRLKNLAKIQRINNSDVKILNIVQDFLSVVMDAIIETQLLEVDTINKFTDKDFLLNAKYGLSIDLDDFTRYKLYSMLGDKSTQLYKIQRERSSGGRGRRYRYDAYIFNINSIGDCFVLFNIHLNYILSRIEYVLNTYDRFKEAKDKNNDPDNIVYLMNSLKLAYNSVKNAKYGSNNDSMLSKIYREFDAKQIDYKSIIDKVNNFNFEDIQ